MNADEDKYITLRAYSNIWDIQRTLEHISGIKIQSTPLLYAVYFIVALLIESILWLKIPIIRNHVSYFVVLGLAFGISTFLKQVKLDGKNPIKFFMSLGEYLIQNKSYIRCNSVKEDEDVEFNELTAFRINKVKRGGQ